jgi:nucleotide-binding universal stress UspA family protein
MTNGGPILICYDGSDEAAHAIRAAAELLTRRQAVVLDIGPVLTGAESFAALSPGVEVAMLQELNRQSAREIANAGVFVAQEAGFDARAETELSVPTWEGIVDVADQLDAAVIVIGTRAQTGVKEAFEGSVSHDVAKHAARPVLVVPPALA